MAIPVVEIQNVSNQLVNIAYQTGDATNAAGDVAFNRSGHLGIVAGSKVVIEEIRIDVGQLENLRVKNILKYTRSNL